MSARPDLCGGYRGSGIPTAIDSNRLDHCRRFYRTKSFLLVPEGPHRINIRGSQRGGKRGR